MNLQPQQTQFGSQNSRQFYLGQEKSSLTNLMNFSPNPNTIGVDNSQVMNGVSNMTPQKRSISALQNNINFVYENGPQQDTQGSDVMQAQSKKLTNPLTGFLQLFDGQQPIEKLSSGLPALKLEYLPLPHVSNFIQQISPGIKQQPITHPCKADEGKNEINDQKRISSSTAAFQSLTDQNNQ